MVDYYSHFYSHCVATSELWVDRDISSILSWEQFCLPGAVWPYLDIILVVTTWGRGGVVLLASSGWSLGML